MKMRFCNNCDTVVPMNHRCKSDSSAPKKQHPNSHRQVQKLRMEIMVRDFGECVRCRVLYNRWTPDMPGKPLQMHHIKNQAEYPHLRREPTNLIMLCEDCHSVYDNGKINELDFHYNFPPFYE